MPPTTRAKSRLLAKQQTSETRKPPHQRSQIKNDPAAKPIERGVRVFSEQHNFPPASKTILCPDRPNCVTESPWPCQRCSCKKGVFLNLNNECIDCSHSIMEHQDDLLTPWSPAIDYPCERQELVTSVLKRVREIRVVVIRATPQVGKTTLLNLLGRYIVHNSPDLEPVYMEWKMREDRKHVPYEEYMEQAKQKYIKINAKQRKVHGTTQSQGKAKTIFLIDEAQFSYEEDKLWTLLSKNKKNTREGALYVLVCVYGAEGVSHAHQTHIESQALQMHALHRIELRPTKHYPDSMLFTVRETSNVIDKWAMGSRIPIEKGVEEYVFATTEGHPGMVGMLTSFTKILYDKNLKSERLSSTSWHLLIAENEREFTEWLINCGRGVWTTRSESFIKRKLHSDFLREESLYRHLKFPMIQNAMKQVAEFPSGVTRPPTDVLDALGFCHKMGYLHTERKDPTKDDITFTFASPLHRQAAYSRLFAGQISGISLKELCINAIARFSPEQLQNRKKRPSGKGWRIPEAAFQQEMYCCINKERKNLPVLSEYSHSSDGRIDFFMSAKRWGIELLQCGTQSNIIEHLTRFSAGGIYQQWRIIEDYMVINFCPRSAFHQVNIAEEFKAHFINVLIEPEEFVAEIYSHDKQLIKSWTLGEGRKRCNAIDSISVMPERGDQNMSEMERVARDGWKAEKRKADMADERTKEEMVKRLKLEDEVKQMKMQIEMMKREIGKRKRPTEGDGR